LVRETKSADAVVGARFRMAHDPNPVNPEETSATSPPRPRAAKGASDYEWLSQKIDYLRKIAEPVREIHRDVLYEAGAWSVLKLVTQDYLNDVYLSIMANQRRLGRWNRLFYIDLNSATGLVRIENSRVVVAGSAIVGANTWKRGPDRAYDHYVFVEPRTEWVDALRARLTGILPSDRFTVYAEGADTAVPKIVAQLGETKSHYLSVFDPFAFQEGTWDSYGRLLQQTGRGDMIVTFQTTMVKRATPEIVGRFFGAYATEYRDLPESGILDLFKRNLRPYRDVVEHVRITAGGRYGRYFYDLIYAVARTKRGNPFMRSVAQLKDRIQALTGEQIDRMVGYHSLDNYGPAST
jgi:three-Cys-motif partner protein